MPSSAERSERTRRGLRAPAVRLLSIAAGALAAGLTAAVLLAPPGTRASQSRASASLAAGMASLGDTGELSAPLALARATAGDASAQLAEGVRPAPPRSISLAGASPIPVERVGLSHGEIVVPRPDRAGWFEAGARPGEPGRAVIIGHVDTLYGPGAFAPLRWLREGSRVTVLDARGLPHRYVIFSRIQVPKPQFPAQAVYGPSRQPELVLVTCGGSFDRGTGSYSDSVVLHARPL